MQLEDDDYRVFFINAYSQFAQHIICEVRSRSTTIVNASHYYYYNNFRPINEAIPIQSMLGSCTHGMQMNGGLKMLVVLIVQAGS